MALIIDTGPLFAALDRHDQDHDACARLLRESPDELVIPSPVLPELDYLVHERLYPAVFVGVLDDIIAGAYRLEHPTDEDVVRARELCQRYADSDVGFVDAAVLAIVERLNEPKLATLDHRHFRMMRPRHVDALTLLPE